VYLLAMASTAQASTHNHGITMAKAAKQYLADVAPVNKTTSAASAALKSATSTAEAGKAVAPMIAAWEKFDSLVLRQQWPRAAKGDVKVLVVDDGAVIGDLSAISEASPLNFSSLSATLSRDGQTSTTAADILRTDLGLNPPASPS
jgi:hypothetical protein